ncbi:MAG: hypothetical protein E6P95_03960 [Candidatus Moraniibacteriota bacterium]|nr:MAG: hypothetical protein E6P95_03960 [Candidatus Moranbacteria bacterium]
MPLVVVRYKPDRVPDHVMIALTAALPEIVALALHVEEDPEAHLSVEHIMVDTQEIGRFAMNANCLDIMIEANEYPGRVANLDVRRMGIVADVRGVLADYDLNIACGVWVRLIRGSYEEI